MINKYSLTAEEIERLNSSKSTNFVNSLKDYFDKNGKLSQKQEAALMSIIKRVDYHEDLLNLEMTKEVLAYENYFRTDYHGDMLQDSTLECLKSHLSKDEINEKIEDAHAAQYSCSSEINKWTFGDTVDFPKGIKNEKSFVQYKLDNFTTAMKKLKANRFRKVSTKNRMIRIIRELLESDELFLSEDDSNFLNGKYKF